MIRRVVGFDGTPVAGASGARTALFDGGDGEIVTTGRRAVSRAEFERLADEGYITRVDLEGDDAEAVVYRPAGLSMRGDALDAARWRPYGDVEVAAVSRGVADAILLEIARWHQTRALAALMAGRRDAAVTLARRGLMAVPGLRTSEVAADLYGVLYAAASDETKSLARAEMSASLDAAWYNRSMREGVALSRSLVATARPTRRVIRRGVTLLAEFSGLGAAVLYHAAPSSRREAVYCALRAVADNPVSRWPAAFALAAVGAIWKAARWLL